MDKIFCQQIDQEALVELYVAGKLHGQLLDKFEQHLVDCEDHAQAVLLEKALKRGVSDFARGELKARLHDQLKKREDTRFLILRYAAILLVAVITPLILYYQFNVAPDEMAKSISKAEQNQFSDEADMRYEEEKQEEQQEEAPKTPLKERRSATAVTAKESTLPAAPAAGAAHKEPQESVASHENESSLKVPEQSLDELASTHQRLNAVKMSSTPKLEADYPEEIETKSKKTKSGITTHQTFNQDDQSLVLKNEINLKVSEDSLVIRECIGKYIDEGEREKYIIELNITVGIDDKINDIKIIRTTHPSSDLEDCLLNIVRPWILTKNAGPDTINQIIIY